MLINKKIASCLLTPLMIFNMRSGEPKSPLSSSSSSTSSHLSSQLNRTLSSSSAAPSSSTLRSSFSTDTPYKEIDLKDLRALKGNNIIGQLDFIHFFRSLEDIGQNSTYYEWATFLNQIWQPFKDKLYKRQEDKIEWIYHNNPDTPSIKLFYKSQNNTPEKTWPNIFLLHRYTHANARYMAIVGSAHLCQYSTTVIPNPQTIVKPFLEFLQTLSSSHILLETDKIVLPNYKNVKYTSIFQSSTALELNNIVVLTLRTSLNTSTSKPFLTAPATPSRYPFAKRSAPWFLVGSASAVGAAYYFKAPVHVRRGSEVAGVLCAANYLYQRRQ